MFEKLKNLFGVTHPLRDTKASLSAIGLPSDLTKDQESEDRFKNDRLPRYQPQSALDADTIDAVQPDCSCWIPWRRNFHTGEQWYERVSYATMEAALDARNSVLAKRLESEDPEYKNDDPDGFDFEEKIRQEAIHHIAQQISDIQNRSRRGYDW